MHCECILQGETWKEKYFNAHIPPCSTLNSRCFCFAIPTQCLLTTWIWFSFGCDGGLLSSTVAFQQEDSEFKPLFGKFSVEFACSACACVVIPPKDMLVGYIGILNSLLMWPRKELHECQFIPVLLFLPENENQVDGQPFYWTIFKNMEHDSYQVI